LEISARSSFIVERAAYLMRHAVLQRRLAAHDDARLPPAARPARRGLPARSGRTTKRATPPCSTKDADRAPAPHHQRRRQVRLRIAPQQATVAAHRHRRRALPDAKARRTSCVRAGADTVPPTRSKRSG
jgi:hypothetical protein